MKKFIILLLLTHSLFSAIITGNQSKVSVTGGSIAVSAQGVTQIVNSGQVTTIGDGLAPSKARNVRPGDLNDLYDELTVKPQKKNINLKYQAVKYTLAKKIRSYLVSKKIPRYACKFKRTSRGTVLYVKNIKLSLIKNIYPKYYKAFQRFFKNNKNKVPTAKITVKDIRKYHRALYIKYY